MKTGDITLLRNGETIVLELAPEPPLADGDPFTRYSIAQELLKGDEIQCETGDLGPGIAIKFLNAIMATSPKDGTLYVFGVPVDATIEPGTYP